MLITVHTQGTHYSFVPLGQGVLTAQRWFFSPCPHLSSPGWFSLRWDNVYSKHGPDIQYNNNNNKNMDDNFLLYLNLNKKLKNLTHQKQCVPTVILFFFRNSLFKGTLEKTVVMYTVQCMYIVQFMFCNTRNRWRIFCLKGCKTYLF